MMMAKPELGTKRLCTDCGARFYDLNRDPVTCPKCGSQFDVASLTATRHPSAKPRGKPEPEAAADDDQVGEPLVALEEADAEEAETGRAEPEIPDDEDLPAVEEEEEEDLVEEEKEDEFLQDEEEDDDVSALIEGDIEDEED
jgi:uncharacterized protein (TIGR02300 family)